MAYAFGFPRDVTKLIDSLSDWRYRLVRGGGKTPSASAMPLPKLYANMEHGKFYIQCLEFDAHSILAQRFNYPPHTAINIWEGNTLRDATIKVKRFRCSSKDVRPCDLAALWNTCDACEPVEMQLQRSRF